MKMWGIIPLFVVALAGVFVSGCGRKPQPTRVLPKEFTRVPAPESAAAATPFDGDWLSDCHPTATGGLYLKRYYILSRGWFRRETNRYTDSNCTLVIGVPQVVDGSFTIVGDANLPSIAGTKKQVDFVQSNGTRLYDIMALIEDAGELYFGDQSGPQNATTAESRPNALENVIYMSILQ